MPSHCPNEYLQYHDALNHSPKTVRWYSDMLSALNTFLGVDVRLGELTVQCVRAYQSHLRSRRKPNDQPLSDETLHDHIRAIKTSSLRSAFARSDARGTETELPNEIIDYLRERREAATVPGVFWERRGF